MTIDKRNSNVLFRKLTSTLSNTAKKNKEKTDLGYKYLMEMKKEVQSDIFTLDNRIRMLDKSIKNQEAALNTNSIATLPLDSVLMIMDRPNISGFDISELTFIKMKNLGLTSLSKSDSLNSKINTYYNKYLAFFKKAMTFTIEKYHEYGSITSCCCWDISWRCEHESFSP